MDPSINLIHSLDRPPDLQKTPDPDPESFVTPPQTLAPRSEPPLVADQSMGSIRAKIKSKKRKEAAKKSSKVTVVSLLPAAVHQNKKIRSKSSLVLDSAGNPVSKGSVKDVIDKFEAQNGSGQTMEVDIGAVVPSSATVSSSKQVTIDAKIETIKKYMNKEANTSEIIVENQSVLMDENPSDNMVETIGCNDQSESGIDKVVFKKADGFDKENPHVYFDKNGNLFAKFDKSCGYNDINMAGSQQQNQSGDGATSNVWSNPRMSFADMIKKNETVDEIKMKFVPPTKLPNGQKRVCFSADEIKKGGISFSLQLYGYFIGTSMDYQVVNSNLRRMWRAFDLKEITKTAAGFYLCKFKSEKGMKSVLESGPWLVENVPFFINQWEPGTWLEKIEPSKVPIWVCIHNIPIELWNGTGIGKLMSSIGRPLVMDKITMDRCISKSGRLGFARVLVEVMAEEELPTEVEFEYEAVGTFPPRVGKLNVSYQWKPPLCTHCKVFGHSYKLCKVRPRTVDEIAAQVIKDALNVNQSNDGCDGKLDENFDGFVEVGKKNKVVQNQNGNRQAGFNTNLVFNQTYKHGSGGSNFGYTILNGNQQHRQSVFNRMQGQQKQNQNSQQNGQQNRSSHQNSQHSSQHMNNQQGNNYQTRSKSEKSQKNQFQTNMSGGNFTTQQQQPKVHMATKDDGLSSQKLKKAYVVVSDNRSKGKEAQNVIEVMDEDLKTSNRFGGLEVEDDDLDSWDVDNLIYESEKLVVDNYFVLKKHPPVEIKDKWSKAQQDYFFLNASSHGLDASFDNEDVGSEKDGTAIFMQSDIGVVPQNVGTASNLNV